MVLQKLAENRKFKRHRVRLKVIDQQTGELLGYAEDLHIEGMRLISKKLFAPQTEINCWLVKDEETEKIPLTAFRVWSSFYDTVPVFYYSGFHFVNPTSAALDSIQDIIRELPK